VAVAAEALVGRRLGAARRRFPALAVIGAVVVVVFVVAAALASVVAPHDPNATDLLHSYAAPSSGHLLGQDGSGRDVLSRLIYGARLSLLGPLLVVLAAGVIGVPLGLAAGYLGGWVDGVLSRVFDVVFAFPTLLLATIIVATFGTGFKTAVIAVAVTYIPLTARVMRAATLSERERPYIQACRAQGYSTLRVGALHIAPNLSRLMLGQIALYFGYALLDLAGLSFLGLGTQPPTADWGTMLAEASQGIFLQPWGVLPASICIVLVVVSFNLIADGLSESVGLPR
jgi:peptide/nickel transport system permease protein